MSSAQKKMSFEQAVEFVLEREGGYNNHSNDNERETYQTVHQNVLNATYKSLCE